MAAISGLENHLGHLAEVDAPGAPGVSAAHGKAGDGAAFFLPDGTVVLVDEGNDFIKGLRERNDAGPGILIGVAVGYRKEAVGRAVFV